MVAGGQGGMCEEPRRARFPPHGGSSVKITVDQVAATPKGLVVGLRIEWSKGGPVRFHSTTVVWGLLDRETRREIVSALNRQVDLAPQDEVLF